MCPSNTYRSTEGHPYVLNGEVRKPKDGEWYVHPMTDEATRKCGDADGYDYPLVGQDRHILIPEEATRVVTWRVFIEKQQVNLHGAYEAVRTINIPADEDTYVADALAAEVATSFDLVTGETLLVTVDQPPDPSFAWRFNVTGNQATVERTY